MAAGSRTVTLNIVTDDSAATRGMKNVGDAADKAGGKAEAAGHKGAGGFSALAGALSGAGSAFEPVLNLVDSAKEQFEHLHESTSKIGGGLLAMGGIAAATGVALQLAASKDQEATGQLKASIEATGGAYDDYEGKIESAVSAQEHFGHTADETKIALNTLVQATHDPEAALARLGLVADLAAQRHIGLNDAAQLVAKALGGSARLFKQYGIDVGSTGDKAQDTSVALDKLAGQLQGQASASADTFSGHLSSIKAHLEDIVANIGGKIGGALTYIGGAAAGVGAIIESGLLTKLKQIPTVAKSAMSGLGSVISNPYVIGAAAAVGAITEIIHAHHEEQQEIANTVAALRTYYDEAGGSNSNRQFLTLQQMNAGYDAQTAAIRRTAQSTVDYVEKQQGLDPEWLKHIGFATAEGQSLDEVNHKRQQSIDNLGKLAQSYGITTQQALTLANGANVDLTGSYETVKAAVDAYRDATDGASAAVAQMSPNAKKLATDLQNLGDITKTDADRAGALKSAIDDLNGSAKSMEQATEALTTGLAGIKSTVDQNIQSLGAQALSLDVSTDAGAKNRGMILQQVGAIETKLQADVQQHQTMSQVQADYQAQIGSLETTLHQLGFNDAQVKAYIQTIGLTPKDWTTLFQANTEQAQGAVLSLGTALNQLPRNIPINVVVNRIDNSGIATTATGTVHMHALGGLIPGAGTVDNYPALLTPGEFVVTRSGSNLAEAEARFTRQPAAGGAEVAALLREQNALLRALLPSIGSDVADAIKGVGGDAKMMARGRVAGVAV